MTHELKSFSSLIRATPLLGFPVLAEHFRNDI